jgi:hypothetical protein
MTYPQPGQQGPYQAFPGGPGAMPSGIPKPPLPNTVKNAYYLMLGGAVLSVISLFVGLGSKSAMRTAVANASPNLTPDQVTTAVNVGYGVAVVFGLLGAGLWVWMAFANKAGKNWARITGTVFFGIDTLSLLLTLGQHTRTGATTALGLLGWLIGLATVILLWNKASSAYFKPQLPPQQYGAPYGYPQQ